MLVKNPTKYCSDYTKFYNVVPDKGSFGYESSVRLSYYQRLYYELEYTKKVNGICFFFTLTYCDNKVPKFLGRNVHSYKDVRLVTNGSISKVLLREYGSRLRYFCACECGEGSGSRGLGNNPHYHFIFFVQPIHDKNNKPIYDTYKRISVKDFTFLIRELWLGKGEGYYNYKNARFGVVKEGKLGAEVCSPEAFSYVIKYVIKDIVSKETDNVVYSHYYHYSLDNCVTWQNLYQYYFYLKKKKSYYRKETFFAEFDLHAYWFQRHHQITSLSLHDWFKKVASEYVFSNYLKFRQWFDKEYAQDYACYKVREFNNNYGPKVRLSNGLGEYGLNFIQNKSTNPTVVFNYGGQIVSQYPCLYYVRKLYYYVVKCPNTGNPLYFLNDLGLDLRIYQLQSKLEKFKSNLIESISFASANDVYIPTKFDSVQYQRFLDSLLEQDLLCYQDYGHGILQQLKSRSDYDYMLQCYSVYVNVYQYRHFHPKYDVISVDSNLDLYNIVSDYRYFLVHRPSFLDFDNCGVMSLCAKNPELVSFRDYYVFEPFVCYFDFFDSLLGAVTMVRSQSKKKLFAEEGDHRKKIASYNVNCSTNGF